MQIVMIAGCFAAHGAPCLFETWPRGEESDVARVKPERILRRFDRVFIKRRRRNRRVFQHETAGVRIFLVDEAKKESASVVGCLLTADLTKLCGIHLKSPSDK